MAKTFMAVNSALWMLKLKWESSSIAKKFTASKKSSKELDNLASSNSTFNFPDKPKNISKNLYMGKIHISDDLRSKLNNVLSFKQSDIQKSTSPPVAPAPNWNNNLEHKKPPPPPPPPPNLQSQPIQQPQQSQQQYSSFEKQQLKKKKKKNKKINYYRYSKLVFITSVVAGIGLTFGLKIGNFIFY